MKDFDNKTELSVSILQLKTKSLRISIILKLQIGKKKDVTISLH